MVCCGLTSGFIGQVSLRKELHRMDCMLDQRYGLLLTAADYNPQEILENYTAVTGRAPEIPGGPYGPVAVQLRYRRRRKCFKWHAATRRKASKSIRLSSISSTGPYRATGNSMKNTGWTPRPWWTSFIPWESKVIVSVWPSVDRKSENFQPMMDRGLLISTERGALTRPMIIRATA